MRNMTVSQKGKKLILEIDLDGETWKPRSNPNSSNRMVASTDGNLPVPVEGIEGGVVYIGCNAYFKS